jgi:hypothetical protein
LNAYITTKRFALDVASVLVKVLIVLVFDVQLNRAHKIVNEKLKKASEAFTK